MSKTFCRSENTNLIYFMKKNRKHAVFQYLILILSGGSAKKFYKIYCNFELPKATQG